MSNFLGMKKSGAMVIQRPCWWSPGPINRSDTLGPLDHLWSHKDYAPPCNYHTCMRQPLGGWSQNMREMEVTDILCYKLCMSGSVGRTHFAAALTIINIISQIQKHKIALLVERSLSLCNYIILFQTSFHGLTQPPPHIPPCDTTSIGGVPQGFPHLIISPTQMTHS